MTSVHEELWERWRGTVEWQGELGDDGHLATVIDCFEACGLLAAGDADRWRARLSRALHALELDPWPVEVRARARELIDAADDDEEASMLAELGVISGRELGEILMRLYPEDADDPLLRDHPGRVEWVIPGSPAPVGGLVFAYAAVEQRVTRLVLHGPHPRPSRDDDYRELLRHPLTLRDDLGTSYGEPSVGGGADGDRVYATALVPAAVPDAAQWIEVGFAGEAVRVPARA